MSKYTVNPTFTYDDNDMVDIISSATYDICYWGSVDDGANEWWEARDEMPKGSTYEDLMYHILKKGQYIFIVDVESDSEDEEYWELNLDMLLKGIKLTIENGYWSGQMDDIDGQVGDIIFQYALFDEIVYG